MLHDAGIVQGLPEYGALGALIAALIWTLRHVVTTLTGIVQANTAAITELREALRGKVVDCPAAEWGEQPRRRAQTREA